MGRRRRQPVELNAEKLGPIIHELMPIGAAGELPERVLGYHNCKGHCHRIVAWASGWRITVRLNAKLEVTSTSASLKLTARKPADA